MWCAPLSTPRGMGPHQSDRHKGQPGSNVIMLGVLHVSFILEVRDISTPSPWRQFNTTQHKECALSGPLSWCSLTGNLALCSRSKCLSRLSGT